MYKKQQSLERPTVLLDSVRPVLVLLSYLSMHDDRKLIDGSHYITGHCKYDWSIAAYVSTLERHLQNQQNHVEGDLNLRLRKDLEKA